MVFADVGLMAAEADSERVAHATRRLRVFAGYAGWGGGQLEAELERVRGSWSRRPTRTSSASGDVWADVLRRKGGAFTLVATMPEDPSLN